jgi:hypothetical protein
MFSLILKKNQVAPARTLFKDANTQNTIKMKRISMICGLIVAKVAPCV